MELRTVVFISQWCESYSESQLEKLMDHSLTNNKKNDITSVLLTSAGYFLEVLEGPPAAIESTIERIRHDTRHVNFEILLDAPIPHRSFGDASMLLLQPEHEEPVCRESFRKIAAAAAKNESLAREIAFSLIEKFFNDHAAKPTIERAA